MKIWTRPRLIRLNVTETFGGSGPCPDGDGGSEAM